MSTLQFWILTSFLLYALHKLYIYLWDKEYYSIDEMYRDQFRAEIEAKSKYDMALFEWKLSDRKTMPPKPPTMKIRILKEGYEARWDEIAKEFEGF